MIPLRKHHCSVTTITPPLVIYQIVVMMTTIVLMLLNSNNVESFTHNTPGVLVHWQQQQQQRTQRTRKIIGGSCCTSPQLHVQSTFCGIRPPSTIQPMTIVSASVNHNNDNNNQISTMLVPGMKIFSMRTTGRLMMNNARLCSFSVFRRFSSLRQQLASSSSSSLSMRMLLPRLQRRIRYHKILGFVTSFLLLWMINMNSLGVSSIAHATPSSSSSKSSSEVVLTERILDRFSNSNVDRIIEQYVQQHMFDDDVSSCDPVVGTYREAYYDATMPQQYPTTLRNIITNTLRGSKLSAPTFTSNVEKKPPFDVGLALTRTVQLLQRTMGLTEFTATIVLAIVFVLAGPSFFLLFGMIVGGISKRNMDTIFKKRYGETYTVDATIKQEPTVELPSEDDDDDDEEDDDNDDEDDDDDDDESKSTGKNMNKKK